ncbi:HlyD family efflux transporter periplasmic adaptor subunit [Pseudolabrys taiwanensis]|uniref:HlyD family efflux transporter periplasmic adaptor subunit n=1 Tax=Pseudolabrys taiwanensis TaxID=331696 RepID=A0A346A2W6_9HYPH|nr:HlyD family efflux transporter periplasmic adaptor subunit [Pseudolabrys taiwanensis]
MQPERSQTGQETLASDRLIGVRGPHAAQRARALHLAAVAESASPAVEPDAPEVPSTEPLASPAADRGSPAADASAPHAKAAGEPTAATTAPAGGNRRKRFLLGGIAALAVLAAGWYGTHWLTVGRFLVSTDDAYVRADTTTLAAKVSGYISSVDVTDNTFVHAGEVIARIDDGDYRLAVDAARDKVATQRATVARIGEQIPAQEAAVEQARAQLVSAQAAATRAQSELTRQQALAVRDFASKQTLEQAQATNDQANASVQSAKAAIDAAIANVAVLRAQQQEAARTLQELQTAQAKAERDLSFTQIKAPIDGVIGNRAIRVGDFVQTGTRLASLVPLDEVYIDANFKETQLARLKPGQPVDIRVDALPDHDITGTVLSVSPASGSVFSLLPPDNATGNFTKIVQRLPVRIQLPPDVAAKRLLRPGMSVVVDVNTKANTSVAAHGDMTFAAQAAGRVR